MSRVLKLDPAQGAPDIQPIRAAFQMAREPTPAAPDSHEVERLALREECARLKQKLQVAEAATAKLRGEAEVAIREAEIRGREAGLRAADDRAADRLQRLDDGIARALSDFNATISSLERLGPLLAREGLAGIFGHTGTRIDLVTDIISHQISRLDANAIVRIEVSAADFADDDAIKDLIRVNGHRAIDVRRFDALKSGECRIKLVLGTLEVGINQQWARLDGVLLELAEPETNRHG